MNFKIIRNLEHAQSKMPQNKGFNFFRIQKMQLNKLSTFRKSSYRKREDGSKAQCH